MIGDVRLAWRRSFPWFLLAMVACSVLVLKLRLSFDLSAFLPKETSLAQEVLLEQLRSGPGSRLVIIGIGGADRDRLADASTELRSVLSARPEFQSVNNGEPPDDIDRPPEPVYSYFLLMRDIDYSEASLRTAMEARLQDLAFGGGAAMLDLISRDPFLVTLGLLEKLSPLDIHGDPWFAKNGSAVVIAESRAPSIDIGAQTEAIDAVRRAFDSISDSDTLTLEITGVGAFSVELQKTIRAEAKMRSVFASVAIMLVVLVFYRKLRYLVLSVLPLGMGFLVGLAAVSLVFDSVHGITLAFGFTLMGVAIDYPLHLFSHSQDSKSSEPIARIWPTMRLGAVSTAVAYLAMAFTASSGLAQLGLFTASGVIVAVVVTRFWLPGLMPDPKTAPHSLPGAALHTAPGFLPAALVLTIAAVTAAFWLQGGLWDDRLSSLSPVPDERLLADRELRSAVNTADLRYQIVLSNESLNGLLAETEKLDERLASAISTGVLESWQSVANLLPSDARLVSRAAAIPDEAELRSRVDKLVLNTPFRSGAFSPFVSAASYLKSNPSLSVEQFMDTPLRSWLDSHLLKVDNTWVSLISLGKPDATALTEAISQWGGGAELVDLQRSSVALILDYRTNALSAVAFAALLIVALLWYQRRDIRQVVWIVCTVLAALAVTVLSIVVLHGQLTVIHLVALLLVMGLGLDYALFLSRRESVVERHRSDHAVMACAISTTLAFGILAASTIPVLKFLGLTVATGSAASYLLAIAGGRLTARTVS